MSDLPSVNSALASRLLASRVENTLAAAAASSHVAGTAAASPLSPRAPLSARVRQTARRAAPPPHERSVAAASSSVQSITLVPVSPLTAVHSGRGGPGAAASSPASSLPGFMSLLLHPSTHPALQSVRNVATRRAREVAELEVASSVYGPLALAAGLPGKPWLSHSRPLSSLSSTELRAFREHIFHHQDVRLLLHLLWELATPKRSSHDGLLSFAGFKGVYLRVGKRLSGGSGTGSGSSGRYDPRALAQRCEDEWRRGTSGDQGASASSSSYSSSAVAPAPSSSREFARVQGMPVEEFMRRIFFGLIDPYMSNEGAVGGAGVGAETKEGGAAEGEEDAASSSTLAAIWSGPAGPARLSGPLGPHGVRIPLPSSERYVILLEHLLRSITDRQEQQPQSDTQQLQYTFALRELPRVISGSDDNRSGQSTPLLRGLTNEEEVQRCRAYTITAIQTLLSQHSNNNAQQAQPAASTNTTTTMTQLKQQQQQQQQLQLQPRQSLAHRVPVSTHSTASSRTAVVDADAEAITAALTASLARSVTPPSPTVHASSSSSSPVRAAAAAAAASPLAPSPHMRAPIFIGGGTMSLPLGLGGVQDSNGLVRSSTATATSITASRAGGPTTQQCMPASPLTRDSSAGSVAAWGDRTTDDEAEEEASRRHAQQQHPHPPKSRHSHASHPQSPLSSFPPSSSSSPSSPSKRALSSSTHTKSSSSRSGAPGGGGGGGGGKGTNSAAAPSPSSPSTSSPASSSPALGPMAKGGGGGGPSRSPMSPTVLAPSRRQQNVATAVTASNNNANTAAPAMAPDASVTGGATASAGAAAAGAVISRTSSPRLPSSILRSPLSLAAARPRFRSLVSMAMAEKRRANERDAAVFAATAAGGASDGSDAAAAAVSKPPSADHTSSLLSSLRNLVKLGSSSINAHLAALHRREARANELANELALQAANEMRNSRAASRVPSRSTTPTPQAQEAAVLNRVAASIATAATAGNASDTAAVATTEVVGAGAGSNNVIEVISDDAMPEGMDNREEEAEYGAIEAAGMVVAAFPSSSPSSSPLPADVAVVDGAGLEAEVSTLFSLVSSAHLASRGRKNSLDRMIDAAQAMSLASNMALDSLPDFILEDAARANETPAQRKARLQLQALQVAKEAAEARRARREERERTMSMMVAASPTASRQRDSSPRRASTLHAGGGGGGGGSSKSLHHSGSHSPTKFGGAATATSSSSSSSPRRSGLAHRGGGSVVAQPTGSASSSASSLTSSTASLKHAPAPSVAAEADAAVSENAVTATTAEAEARANDMAEVHEDEERPEEEEEEGEEEEQEEALATEETLARAHEETDPLASGAQQPRHPADALDDAVAPSLSPAAQQSSAPDPPVLDARSEAALEASLALQARRIRTKQLRLAQNQSRELARLRRQDRVSMNQAQGEELRAQLAAEKALAAAVQAQEVALRRAAVRAPRILVPVFSSSGTPPPNVGQRPMGVLVEGEEGDPQAQYEAFIDGVLASAEEGEEGGGGEHGSSKRRPPSGPGLHQRKVSSLRAPSASTGGGGGGARGHKRFTTAFEALLVSAVQHADEPGSGAGAGTGLAAAAPIAVDPFAHIARAAEPIIPVDAKRSSSRTTTTTTTQAQVLDAIIQGGDVDPAQLASMSHASAYPAVERALQAREAITQARITRQLKERMGEGTTQTAAETRGVQKDKERTHSPSHRGVPPTPPTVPKRRRSPSPKRAAAPPVAAAAPAVVPPSPASTTGPIIDGVPSTGDEEVSGHPAGAEEAPLPPSASLAHSHSHSHAEVLATEDEEEAAAVAADEQEDEMEEVEENEQVEEPHTVAEKSPAAAASTSPVVTAATLGGSKSSASPSGGTHQGSKSSTSSTSKTSSHPRAAQPSPRKSNAGMRHEPYTPHADATAAAAAAATAAASTSTTKVSPPRSSSSSSRKSPAPRHIVSLHLSPPPSTAATPLLSLPPNPADTAAPMLDDISLSPPPTRPPKPLQTNFLRRRQGMTGQQQQRPSRAITSTPSSRTTEGGNSGKKKNKVSELGLENRAEEEEEKEPSARTPDAAASTTEESVEGEEVGSPAHDPTDAFEQVHIDSQAASMKAGAEESKEEAETHQVHAEGADATKAHVTAAAADPEAAAATSIAAGDSAPPSLPAPGGGVPLTASQSLVHALSSARTPKEVLYLQRLLQVCRASVAHSRGAVSEPGLAPVAASAAASAGAGAGGGRVHPHTYTSTFALPSRRLLDRWTRTGNEIIQAAEAPIRQQQQQQQHSRTQGIHSARHSSSPPHAPPSAASQSTTNSSSSTTGLESRSPPAQRLLHSTTVGGLASSSSPSSSASLLPALPPGVLALKEPRRHSLALRPPSNVTSSTQGGQSATASSMPSVVLHPSQASLLARSQSIFSSKIGRSVDIGGSVTDRSRPAQRAAKRWTQRSPVRHTGSGSGSQSARRATDPTAVTADAVYEKSMMQGGGRSRSPSPPSPRLSSSMSKPPAVLMASDRLERIVLPPFPPPSSRSAHTYINASEPISNSTYIVPQAPSRLQQELYAYIAATGSSADGGAAPGGRTPSLLPRSLPPRYSSSSVAARDARWLSQLSLRMQQGWSLHIPLHAREAFDPDTAEEQMAHREVGALATRARQEHNWGKRTQWSDDTAKE